jgi:hypothetical protein
MVCVGGTDDDALNENRPGLFSPGPHLLCGVAGNRTRHRIGPCPQWLADLDVSAKSPPPPSTCSKEWALGAREHIAQASENNWHAAFPLLQHLESTTTSHRQLRPITRVRPRIHSATAQFANGGRHPPHPSHLTLKSTCPQGHLRDLAPTAIVTPRIELRPLHATVPERRELYRRVDVEENRQPHLTTAGSHSSLNRTGLNAFNELKGHMWLEIDEPQNSGSRSQPEFQQSGGPK